MLRTWEGFVEFLEAHGCELVDESDWGYPIYRRKGNGRFCGLDMGKPLDDFMICAVCAAFLIDPPEQHDNGVKTLIKEIIDGFEDDGTTEETEEPPKASS